MWDETQPGPPRFFLDPPPTNITALQDRGELDPTTVGTTLQFFADELFLAGDDVWVNLRGQGAFQLQGVSGAHVRAILKERRPQVFQVCGTIKETRLSFYQRRLQQLGLDAEAATVQWGDVRFTNPVGRLETRRRQWLDDPRPPYFAPSHRDLHGGNVLCVDQRAFVIDHGLFSERQPVWADAARLVGTLWRNALSPHLTPEQAAQALDAACRGATKPLDPKTQTIAAFLKALFQLCLEATQIPRANDERDFWLNLHYFAWITLKWDPPDAANPAMLLLVAATGERVDQARADLARHQGLIETIGRPGPITTLPEQAVKVVAQTDHHLSQLNAAGDDARAALWELMADQWEQGMARLQEDSAARGGWVERLLQKAVTNEWKATDTTTASKIRGDHARFDQGDRVVLADTLFIAFMRGHQDVFPLILDLGGDGEPQVEAEVCLLLVWMLSIPETWEYLEEAGPIKNRVRRLLSSPELKEWVSYAHLVNQENPQPRPVIPAATLMVKQAQTPIMTWLKPFNRSGPVLVDAQGKQHEKFRDQLADSISLIPIEKSLILHLLMNTGSKTSNQLSLILSKEQKAFRFYSKSRLWLHFRRDTLRTFFSEILSFERKTWLGSRKSYFQKSLAELVSEEQVANLIKAREAVEAFHEKKKKREFKKAVNLALSADDAFSKVDAWQKLHAQDLYLWQSCLQFLADQNNDTTEKIRLNHQACELCRRVITQEPNNHIMMTHWANHLSNLAQLAATPTETRSLRELALEKYTAALQLKPDDDLALISSGFELSELAALAATHDEARSLREQALEQFTAALQLKPDLHQARITFGLELSKLAALATTPDETRSLREQAIQQYTAALQLKPDDHLALISTGFELSELAALATTPNEARSLREQALEQYAAALQLKPDLHQVRITSGLELSKLAALATTPDETRSLREQAIQQFTAALQLKPDDHHALFSFGFHLSKLAALADTPNEARSLRERALEQYAAALQLKPDLHQVRISSGLELNELAALADTPTETRSRREQALEQFTAALQLKPDDHRALLGSGLELSELAALAPTPDVARSHREQAIEQFTAALQLKPDFHEVRFTSGLELSKLAALATTPDETRSLREQALEQFTAALQLKPDDHRSHLGSGLELSELAALAPTPDEARSRREQAIEQFTAALQLKPDFHEVRFTSGLELSKLAALATTPDETRSLREQAIEQFTAALQLKPDFHEVRFTSGLELSKLAALATTPDET
ncbi:hypothetical protein J3U88_32205, partial [Acanthopleuribacter pedis]|nr:hypothetical protein [Acanthopleuribacter pedis]